MKNYNNTYKYGKQGRRFGDNSKSDNYENDIEHIVQNDNYDSHSQTKEQNTQKYDGKFRQNSGNKQNYSKTGRKQRQIKPGDSPISFGSKGTSKPFSFTPETKVKSSFSEYSVPNDVNINVKEGDFILQNMSPLNVSGYFIYGLDPYQTIKKVCKERYIESTFASLYSNQVSITNDALFIYFLFNLATQLYSLLNITNDDTLLFNFKSLLTVQVNVPTCISSLCPFFGTINAVEGVYKQVGIETVLVNSLLQGYILMKENSSSINDLFEKKNEIVKDQEGDVHISKREKHSDNELIYSQDTGYLFQVSNIWEGLVYLSKIHTILDNNDKVPFSTIPVEDYFIEFNIIDESVQVLQSKLKLSSLGDKSKAKIQFLLSLKDISSDFNSLLKIKENVFNVLNIKVMNVNLRHFLNLYLSALNDFNTKAHPVLSTNFKFQAPVTCLTGSLGQLLSFDQQYRSNVPFQLNQTDIAIGYMLGVKCEFIHKPKFSVISNLSRVDWFKRQFFESSKPILS